MDSIMFRTTARLGVFVFGLLATLSGAFELLDPKPQDGGQPVFAGALVLVGVVTMVSTRRRSG